VKHAVHKRTAPSIDSLAASLASSSTPEERARLESLGTMAAVLAHELQNILTPICGYSSLALQSLDADAPARRSVERVHAAATRARQIAGSILSIAKGSASTEVSRCQIAAAFQHAVDMLGREPGRIGISIAADIQQDLIAAIDQTAMVQVFVNALMNACRAMGGDGTITVGACATGNAADDSVLIEIADSGPGLSDSQLQQLRNGRLGSGFGLPIARWLIEASGGSLHVDSPATGGTVIRISLPAASSAAQQHHVARL
jgi:signal transduction histidine kinase